MMAVDRLKQFDRLLKKLSEWFHTKRTCLFHSVVQLREGVDGGQATVFPHLV